MQTTTGLKLLCLLLALCLLIIGGLGYYSWHLSQQLQKAASRAPASPFSFSQDPWPDAWDPKRDQWDLAGRFSELQKRMDEMLGSMSPDRSIFNNQGFGLSQSSPRITMQETNDAYTITVAVPRGQEVELNTELSDKRLKITGKVTNSSEEKDEGMFGGSSTYSTLSASRFSQTVTLPFSLRLSADDNVRRRVKFHPPFCCDVAVESLFGFFKN